RRIDEEKALDEKKKKAAKERHLYLTIKLVTLTTFEHYQGFDLANFDNQQYPQSDVLLIKVLKSFKFRAFKTIVAHKFGISPEKMRVWDLINRQNRTIRPDTPIPNDFLDMTMEEIHKKVSPRQNELKLFLEMVDKPLSTVILSPKERNSYLLVFIKYFNPDTQSLEGMCYLYVRKHSKVGDIIPILCEKKNFPSHTKLKIYEEIRPRMIAKIVPSLTFQQSEIQNGDIICFQKALTKEEIQIHTSTGRICDIPTFYESLLMRVVVKFKPKCKDHELKPEFELILNEKYTYEEVAKRVSAFLNTDPLKLQFATAHPMSGTYKTVIKRTTKRTLSEMLQTTYLPNSTRLLYYEMLDISIIELETKKFLKVYWLGTTVKEEQAIDICLPKTAIIYEVLQVIGQKLAIPKPTHRIRLYDALNCKIQNEYNINDPIDKIQEQVTLYAEEIPKDEIELGANDKIIQAFHFTKEPLRAHGIPFKFVLKAGEPFSMTKLRLQLRLGMFVKDFLKVKVAIIQVASYAKPQYIEDNNVILSNYGLTDKLLGLDHVDKTGRAGRADANLNAPACVSGNQDIDNLINATYVNQLKFRLEWIPFENFTDIKQIGNGGFSEIHTATWTKGKITAWSELKKKFNRKQTVVVLKVLKDSKNIHSTFLKELQNIVKSQPNSTIRRIVQCYGVSQDPKTKNYIFVMAYMPNGSLNNYLSNNFKNITWKMKLDFLKDIVAGIKWIHENKIIHRDIHDGNILIGNLKNNGSDSNSLIADLGFSRPANDNLESSELKIYGIMPYIAPEVLNKKQYSFRSDIYSLGMIMWELTSGSRPFYDKGYDVHLMLDICNERLPLRPNVTEDTPRCWSILMQKCWQSDPLKRPTINEIFDEVNSKYWNENSCYMQAAEIKRQELINTGKFVAKYMHPHSKTHSKLLNPTIDSMFQYSRSFQNISSDLFNIIPQHFKNYNSPNSTINPSISKKHTIKVLQNENDYNKIKRRKLFNNEMLDSKPYIISINGAIHQITNLSNLNLNHDKLCYEAGKALCTNPILKDLDWTLCDGTWQGIVEVLGNNKTLTNLNIENKTLSDDAAIALAKNLYKNTTLIYLNLRHSQFDSEAIKILAGALCENTTLTNLYLSRNKLGKSGEKVLAEALCKNTTLTNLDLSSNNLGESGGKALAEALCNNNTLTNLDLSLNNIRESGVKALAEALCKNTTLTNLNLSWNILGESG
ncbi:8875_t:CDS:10, partial [Cetraspora pellucida]